MKWHKSESTIQPDEVDTTSSKTSVFLRRNIKETTRWDELSEDESTIYKYEETALSKKEYAEYLKGLALIDIQQQRADIDYIALCCDVDLEDL